MNAASRNNKQSRWTGACKTPQRQHTTHNSQLQAAGVNHQFSFATLWMTTAAAANLPFSLRCANLVIYTITINNHHCATAQCRGELLGVYSMNDGTSHSLEEIRTLHHPHTKTLASRNLQRCSTCVLLRIALRHEVPTVKLSEVRGSRLTAHGQL